MPRRAALSVVLATAAALAAAVPSLAASRVKAQDDANDSELIPRREFPSQVREAPKRAETPAVLRWMIKPLRRGMFIRLPVVDTDPNRGVTVGVMPIVVLQGETDDRIRAIHAPSLTYNKNFFITPTYRYYFYPQDDAALVARGSLSRYERELMGQYEDRSVGGTNHDLFARLQYNVDAGMRFYGIGPSTPKENETNYKDDYWLFKWGFGSPVGGQDSSWRLRMAQHYQAGRILNGPLPNLPEFRRVFPQHYSGGAQQNMETRAVIDYDTRDHGVTMTRGAFMQAYVGGAKSGYLGAYDYERFGFDWRWYRPWDASASRVLAVQARTEQMLGPGTPFWLMPRLGGKYSLRAYGEGRYVDRGMAVLNVEQRLKVFEQKTAGVVTEFQVAPFVGVGTVYPKTGKASRRYARPVFGSAVRAVAKPQVVGSVDVGVGQEGVSVFMDVNYSF